MSLLRKQSYSKKNPGEPEAALQERDEVLSQIIQGNSIPTFVINRERVVTHWNRACENLTALSAGDIIGTRRHWAAFYPEERPVLADLIVSNVSRQAVAEYYDQGITESVLVEGAYEAEGFFPSLGERGKWLYFTAAPLRDTEGTAIGAIETLQDITHRKRLEEQLRHAQKMEAIGTLAGGIAHDFNNILGGIIGYTELALTDMTPDPDNKRYIYLSRVLEAGNRAKELVLQILRFSRGGDATIGAISLAAVIKESVKLLKSTLPATIAIEQCIQVESDGIMGDPTQIHQVVMNLCTNAYHAMREKGGILGVSLNNVRLERSREFMTLKVPPGDYIKLSVSDTGHGVPPEMLGRIFEPYFTTKETAGGTGLGLSVTSGIVRGHKGLIEVESEMGRGTRFDVYFPVTRTNPVEPPSSERNLPVGNGERVLVVDDELFFLDVIKENLQALGYRVSAYQSSMRTLEALKSNPKGFDLVITDQSMPEMTGIQLVAEIRRFNKSVPIVLCTGYSENIGENSARPHGVAMFLMKPVAAIDLAWAVHKALGGRR